MKSRFDPVLFDLDGTLVDSGRDIAAAINHTLEDLGLVPLPQDEVLGYVGDGVRRLMERVLRKLERDDVDEQIKNFRAYYREHALDNTLPYPGLPEILRDLRPARVGVVTNKPGYFARMILDGLSLSEYFGVLIGGDETENMKPDPEPIFAACEKLGLPPAAGIMIGDYHNDIQAGRAAGMSTCGVLWGFAGSEPVMATKPDYLAADADELRKVLFE